MHIVILDGVARNGGSTKGIAWPEALSQDETNRRCNDGYRFASVPFEG